MATRQPLNPARVLLVGLAFTLGCAGVATTRVATPRVSEMVGGGDDLYRASQKLVLEGLDADVAGASDRARSRYERALQIDASNPWAYLALARHYVDVGQPGQALSHLDRAQALLESMEQDTPGARVHCDGLRGAALRLRGRHAEARLLLEDAARAAPGVWGDGRLTASELR